MFRSVRTYGKLSLVVLVAVLGVGGFQGDNTRHIQTGVISVG
jgi:hypothetical protein